VIAVVKGRADTGKDPGREQTGSRNLPSAPAETASLPVLIITGLSGSGKSTVLRTLEDVGYFCVDNLPLSLLSRLLHTVVPPQGEARRVALVMDVRTQGFIKNYARVFRRLEQQGYQFHILFLEADEDALIRRFSQTRRQHPLADQESIAQALRLERSELEGLRRLARRIINTSTYNPHQLRKLILAEYADLEVRERLLLHLMSFSYKKGIPAEADLVFDVRFLPNPFFVEELRPHTGNDPGVRDFVLSQSETREFLERLYGFVDYLLPRFQEEGKTHLTVALGCTGGQHRSVVIANILGEHLSQENIPFTLTHRDLAPLQEKEA
jgi:UPF0042 nucleotide-binding protein